MTDSRNTIKPGLPRQLRILSQKRFGRFLLVGGSATLLQYLLLILLAEMTPLAHHYCSAFSYALAAVFNYLANYYFTFQASSKHSSTSFRFAITVALGLGLNTLVFYLANTLLPHYLLSQIVATGVTLTSNYLLHKHWTYR